LYVRISSFFKMYKKGGYTIIIVLIQDLKFKN